MSLRRIVLRDFVIVPSLDLDLDQGFNVLTGETGARDFLNRDPDRVTAVDLPALADDLDTPDDYRAAVQRES